MCSRSKTVSRVGNMVHGGVFVANYGMSKVSRILSEFADGKLDNFQYLKTCSL